MENKLYESVLAGAIPTSAINEAEVRPSPEIVKFIDKNSYLTYFVFSTKLKTISDPIKNIAKNVYIKNIIFDQAKILRVGWLISTNIILNV